MTPSVSVPTYQIDQSIDNFIEDMQRYLNMFYGALSETDQVQLVISSVKGEARDIISGYSRKEKSSTKTLFRSLRNEFKRRAKHIDSLHQLKQEPQEKVIVFVGRIRRHVNHLGLKEKYIDKTCLRYLCIGSLQYIQNSLTQRNPKCFSKAMKLANEVELEKVKSKSKVPESINTMQKGHTPTCNDNEMPCVSLYKTDEPKERI